MQVSRMRCIHLTGFKPAILHQCGPRDAGCTINARIRKERIGFVTALVFQICVYRRADSTGQLQIMVEQQKFHYVRINFVMHYLYALK